MRFLTLRSRNRRFSAADREQPSQLDQHDKNRRKRGKQGSHVVTPLMAHGKRLREPGSDLSRCSRRSYF